jgi:hypothetical protein
VNRRVVMLAGILVLVLLTVSGPATAEPGQPPIGRPLYLALGIRWRPGWAPPTRR